jgi:hypothetical protein
MLQAGDPGWVPNRNSAALQASVAGGSGGGDSSSSSSKDNLAVAGLADANDSGSGGGGDNSEGLHDLKAAVTDMQANLKALTDLVSAGMGGAYARGEE